MIRAALDRDATLVGPAGDAGAGELPGGAASLISSRFLAVGTGSTEQGLGGSSLPPVIVRRKAETTDRRRVRPRLQLHAFAVGDPDRIVLGQLGQKVHHCLEAAGVG